ncbi:MAG: ABC transporter permease [Chloroflexota bacterium]
MLDKMWAVAAKDLRQFSRDRAALVMMFAVPLLLMAILGSAFANLGDGGSSGPTVLPVVDHDGGPEARALIDGLRQTPSLTVQMTTDENAAEQAVRDGSQVGLLIIPAGFSTAVEGSQPVAKVTYYRVANNGSRGAQAARDRVEAVVQRLAFARVTAEAVSRAQIQAGGKADPAIVGQLVARASRQLDQSPPVAIQMVSATGGSANPQDNAVPGYALMFALFGLMGGAGSILEEKDAGTIKRLLIAPLSTAALLGGKLLAQFIQSLVQLTVLFGLGALLFKIDLGASLLALALVIVGTSFAATGLGMVLVSFVKSQRQVRPVTMLIVLSFSALGGSWWPISTEPAWMQSVGLVTLNAWAMRGFNGLMIFDQGFAQVLPDIAVLFGYGLICFALARRTFRFREA